ncbi:MAG: NUDIX domain-containing protein [Myxococcales bacterium]|nr:NUDIX domain-containing protein [Myxococcales bacterium]
MAAQDPNERFDVCDRDGRPTGEVKARGLVHRDGDWHRALHLWVLSTATPPTLILQVRGSHKDTHPGCLDVSAAGHLQAGEGFEDALRESEEELGLAVDRRAVTLVGWRRLERLTPAWRDREYQRVYVTRQPWSLDALRLHPDELDGAVALSLDALEVMLDAPAQPVEVLRRWGDAVAPGTVTGAQLTPGSGPYLRAVLAWVRRWLAGEAPEPEALPG